MNCNEEREYWMRVVDEVLTASGDTMEQLADRVKASPRQVYRWKFHGERPTGLVAIRLFEYRRELAELRPSVFTVVVTCTA